MTEIRTIDKINFLENKNSILKNNIDKISKQNKELKKNIDNISSLVSSLEAENAALRMKLNRSRELPCNVGDNLYVVSLIFSDSYKEDVLTGSICYKLSECTVTEKNIYRMCELVKEKKAYYTKEEANAKIDELLNINNEIEIINKR